MISSAIPLDIPGDAVSVVGPLGTVIAIIAGLYWALSSEKLVTGKGHRREIDAQAAQIAREEREHDQVVERMRADHARQIEQIRSDAVSSASRRELENAATIDGLRTDVTRLFAAWQVTDDALNRVTDARTTANTETMLTLLEAVRHSPLSDRIPRALPPGTVNDGSG